MTAIGGRGAEAFRAEKVNQDCAKDIAMPTDTLVSVIIPTFNRAKVVTEAVESVLDQRWPFVDIVVVDDGSTDDTCQRLARFGNAIRYVRQDNSGVSSARNRGVRESRGGLISFLDSDDLWTPGKLEAQYNLVLREDICSFSSVEWFVDEERNQYRMLEAEGVRWPRVGADGFLLDPVLDVAEGRYLHLGTLLCRRSRFLQVGFFDETLCMGEDEDWFSRASVCSRLHYLSTPLLRRRLHRQQISTQTEASLRSLVRVFEGIVLRTANCHLQARRAAERRLAAKWSHLANNLRRGGLGADAAQAAWRAYQVEPLRLPRLAKAIYLSAFAGKR